ncbi:repeat uncharacterized protein DUF346 [Stackebrandtia albiflava]|uniref:Repeat uncharacterized protein DUF346 n=2 Tax=Stackebrandtia albiflava TaxID=406432 RepID=A0A562UQF6_9ACTN|nr:DUF346 domain-containing protein [Stackebrandtia albiflava]TWJ07824.1 repeat uncharacterized protein DUF346 [Stackebrandtia albiflava]
MRIHSARSGRRRLLSAAVGLAASVALVAPAAAAPFHAPSDDVAIQACDYIPPGHDPAVIRVVYQVGLDHHVNDKVMLAGFEAGWVESHMNNLPCGDKDSLGVFQQRPSQGWGTPEQILDVHYASTQFFVRAVDCDRRYPHYSAGQVAQCVQRSGFPERYDQVEAKARALLAEAQASVSPRTSGQAYLFGGSQRFAGVDVSGSLMNFSWSAGTGVVRADWGGGAVTGVPVGYVHDGLQHVFARGSDDTLRHWYQSGTHPPGLDSWNTTGLVRSDPAGFAYGTQQHVFFRNPQNRLEHRFYDTTTGQVHGGVWSDHTFTGNPYAFVHRDQQHVFARTAEGALLHWYWWPGIAPAVDDWGITTGIASDITGFSYHGTQHHIFYRDTDGHLQHRYYDDASGTLNGGTWPGGTFEGDPHALVHRDQQHVFARNTDGDLVHWYWWPGINPAVDDWGAQNTVTGDPVGLSTPGQHHVFYRTTNGTLAHHWIDDGHHTPHHDNWGGNITP